MARDYLVAINDRGTVGIHAPGGLAGNYATLCGMDGNDPHIGQSPAKLPRGARIDCKHCFQIFQTARAMRWSDFSKEVSTDGDRTP